MKRPLIFTCLFLTLTGCATNRAPGLNMLDIRADYSGKEYINSELSGHDPVRTVPKVEDIYIYPHEMPTGDYFRGGWIRTLVSKGQWKLEEVAPRSTSPKKGPHKKRETELLLKKSY